VVERDLWAPGAPGRVAHPPDALDGGRRAGDTETGRVLRWEFETEPQALRMVDRLLRADSAGQWREQGRGGSLGSPRERRPGQPGAE
jgi:hypothetical protein